MTVDAAACEGCVFCVCISERSSFRHVCSFARHVEWEGCVGEWVGGWGMKKEEEEEGVR